jgi:hypothetical protein
LREAGDWRLARPSTSDKQAVGFARGKSDVVAHAEKEGISVEGVRSHAPSQGRSGIPIVEWKLIQNDNGAVIGGRGNLLGR